MTALVNTRLGRILAVVGPAAADPNYDIAGSPMYRRNAEQASRYLGWRIGARTAYSAFMPSAPCPDRDLSVVVAVDEADAMRPAKPGPGRPVGGVAAATRSCWLRLG